MELDNHQYVNPDVTNKKFKEEVDHFETAKDGYRQKGIFLIDISNLITEFIFTIPKLTPSSIAFAVRIDFTNYDIEPPSVKFIAPFSGKVLTRNEIPIRFLQAQPMNSLQITSQGIPISVQDLLQASAPDEVPFFCIPGIREYHNHPAHTGDSWFLHRKKGEGTLGFILDQLYMHSIPFITYRINMQIGFNQQPPQPPFGMIPGQGL